LGHRKSSLSLLGIFGLLAYLTSAGSPIPLAKYLPAAVDLGYISIPINWFIVALGFIPVALGLLPEGNTSVEV
jgi:hypothetical protein